MAFDSEIETRRLLDEYKWGEHFVCRNCSNKSFKPRQKFGRECKKCGVEETALSYTALTHVRIPMRKVCSILTYLIDNVPINFDEKTIPIRLDTNDNVYHSKEFGSKGQEVVISINELFKKKDERYVSAEMTEVLIENYLQERKLIQSDLAKKFDVNENSLHLLFKKVAKRISFFHEDKWGTESVQIIRNFFGDGQFDLDYVLGMLMVPIDKTWVKNEKKINGKWYKIGPPSRMDHERIRWGIRNTIFGRKSADGINKYYYNKEDEPEYLAEDF